MEAISFFFGIFGNITSVLIFLSPINTFWRIVKRGSTEEFESLPYLCTLLSASLWTYYGIVKPGAFLVATVNGFGILVEAIYVALFLLFAPPKMKAKTAVFMGILNVGFPIAAILVNILALQGEARIDSIGFLCSGLTIVMYGSPLASIRTVLTTRSVEYMPFWLSFFFFLNGGIWTCYGLLVHDYFLLVSNGAGFILGIAQLLLYAIYTCAKPSKLSSAGLEGWQHEQLIPASNQSLET